MNNLDIKKEFFRQCDQFIDSRIRNAKLAMREAQEAANEETKGSVGDKHETGRSMMQIERDKHARMLADALNQKKMLDQVDISGTSISVRSGSLVLTTEGNFFISIGAGKLIAESMEVFAIAPASPIGNLLLGKRKDEEVVFNNRSYTIKDIV